MRSRESIRRISISIAIGLITTIGVAWSCVAWSAPIRAGHPAQNVSIDHPVARAMSRFGQFDGFTLFSYSGVGWRHEHVMASNRRNYAEQNSLDMVSAGWPWLCFEGERRTLKGQTTHWRLLTLPKMLGARSGRLSLIPYSPRLLPFVANVLVFSGVSLLFIIGATTLRRMVRQSRNQCPVCAYSLRGLMPEELIRCPECGASVRPTAPMPHS